MMEWCGRVGEVREKFRSEWCSGVEWEVPKISSMPDKVGPAYYGPDFKFLDSIWYLGIYRPDKEWIGLEIWRSFETPPESVRFSIGLRYADGTKQLMYRDWRYPEKCRFLSLNKLLHAAILMRCKAQLAPSDVLTVTCALWRSVPLPEEDNWLSFSGQKRDNRIVWSACKELNDKDGKTLVSRGTQTEEVSGNGDRNVEFASHDGEDQTRVSQESQTDDASDAATEEERVDLDVEALSKLRTLQKHYRDLLLLKAQRNVLEARSTVLAAVLKNEMKVGNSDPLSFSEFLEYAFIGEVPNRPPDDVMTPDHAQEDEHEYLELKVIPKSSFSTTAICEVITLAIRHGDDCLLETALAFFAGHLEEVMATVEWQRFLLDNPIQANEMCLKAVKIRLHRN